MSEFPREVLMWIQSLDLNSKIVVPKWDLANGYLIAEIFNRYYPFEVEMTYFNKGSSLYAKQHNWQELSKFFKKKKFDISQTCIDGTMFCKETQCMQMMQLIYKILTDRKWPFSVVSPISDDLCDYDYQMRLPLHAQSTATKSVKNNIMFTELLVYPNQLLNARKAQKIIDRHMELRLKKRVEDPERFHVHPTLGQQTVRQQNIVAHKEDVEKAPLKKAVSDSINDMNVRFKDIKLKQPFITQLQ
ncbi:spermatogenesis-associated protein 4 isoform X1 [Octopus bimaculoides]|uniref:CH-like domain-containing protein n=1 Tax=Octopus bimaculoides TaxID=37653 RepID=A0A0L8I5X9_OCTBM|nr:spermatogenesis-associated protein 4 isoform X1 [Octopus bimaculoides]|eukprot:XP_014790863.1 PREDICTED: spermatogenesis-associated protein 4-like isoform X1 [Octopus bimaculoides]